MSRLLAAMLVTLLPFAAAPAEEPQLTRYTFTEPHMGTRFKIIVYAPDEATANRASKAAFARIEQLNGIMSDYVASSELMRLCKKAGGPPVPVSEELFFILSKSQEVAALSDGAFDVSVGPVVRLWRRARKGKQLPDPDELARARQLVDCNQIKLDPKKRTVQLLKPGMQIDLGGIGKGYAADEGVRVLAEHGLKHVLVGAAGDIAVGEAPPGEKGWTIGIAEIDDPAKPPTRHILLANAAVSTCGDVEQYVEIDGKRYSHIVDPKTGIGVLGQFSVTVVSRRGVDSDGLDTAAAVLGPERGLRMIAARPGTGALLVTKIDGKETEAKTNNFPAMSKP